MQRVTKTSETQQATQKPQAKATFRFAPSQTEPDTFRFRCFGVLNPERYQANMQIFRTEAKSGGWHSLKLMHCIPRNPACALIIASINHIALCQHSE